MSVSAIWLIARGVLIEAVRRREVYVIVLMSTLLIGAVMMVDFFEVEGLAKFYREVALKVMSIATALTVVVLAARQLPREFEARTIYPLLARPITRLTFLTGKLVGVLLAAGFCFALFIAVYILGTLHLGAGIPWILLVQFIYLQMVMVLILATLSFWLSMMLHLDAAITIGVLLYTLAATLLNIATYIYDYAGAAGQWMLWLLIHVIPQLSLFDLSGRTVHAEAWDPVRLTVILALTAYGLAFAVIQFGLAALWFRRRPL